MRTPGEQNTGKGWALKRPRRKLGYDEVSNVGVEFYNVAEKTG